MTTTPNTGRVQRTALIASAAGLMLFALGALLDRDLGPVLRSYLVAWTFCLGIALGCLAVVMLQYLTGGAWGLVLRRTLESGSRTLPLLAVLFVPVLLGLPRVYEWVTSRDPALAQKQAYYLNVPFFLARAAGYFAIWLAVMAVLNRWSRRQDERAAGEDMARRFRLLSAPGLVLYGLTVSFAAIDWVMSLEPRWASSIYGVLFGAGQLLSAFAFTVAVVILLADRPPLAGVLSSNHLRDLGGLLLAFVMVWAYLAFSQFLLIWSGNLPEEVPWYLRRLRGGWQWVGAALVLFHFALPFLLLLSADLKRSRRPLLAVAGLVLVMRFVDLFWLIVPSRDDPAGGELARHWADALLSAAALVGLGGLWLAFFLWHLDRRPLLPLHEPLPEGGGHG